MYLAYKDSARILINIYTWFTQFHPISINHMHYFGYSFRITAVITDRKLRRLRDKAVPMVTESGRSHWFFVVYFPYGGHRDWYSRIIFFVMRTQGLELGFRPEHPESYHLDHWGKNVFSLQGQRPNSYHTVCMWRSLRQHRVLRVIVAYTAWCYRAVRVRTVRYLSGFNDRSRADSRRQVIVWDL